VDTLEGTLPVQWTVVRFLALESFSAFAHSTCPLYANTGVSVLLLFGVGASQLQLQSTGALALLVFQSINSFNYDITLSVRSMLSPSYLPSETSEQNVCFWSFRMQVDRRHHYSVQSGTQVYSGFRFRPTSSPASAPRSSNSKWDWNQ